MKTLIKISKLAIIFIILIAAVFKLYSNKKQIDNTIVGLEEKEILIPVEVIQAKEKVTNKQYKLNGVFEAKNNLNLISEVSGKIEKLCVPEGAIIDKGQELFCVENKILKAQLDLALVNLNDTEKNLNRFKNLKASDAVSKKQLEDIQIAFQQAKLNYELALITYENSFIKSPIKGTVNEFFVEIGSYVYPGLAVANILATDTLFLITKVPEQDILKINKRDKVNIIYQGTMKIEAFGSVDYISSKADDSNKFEIKIKVKNPNGVFKPGMFATAVICSESNHKRIIIPRKCLEGSLKDPKVYLINDNQAFLVPIKIEEVIDDFLVINSGISLNNTIVVNGQINLDNGTKVRIL